MPEPQEQAPDTISITVPLPAMPGYDRPTLAGAKPRPQPGCICSCGSDAGGGSGHGLTASVPSAGEVA